MNWLENTTQSYRMGFVEGQHGERNCYLLAEIATDLEQYEEGFAAGLESRKELLKNDGVSNACQPTH